MNPFDQMMTRDGRRGIVKVVREHHAVLVMANGDEETFHVDDLMAVSSGAVDDIRAGRLGDPVAHGLRFRSLFMRHAYRYDLRSGLSNARIEPKLHQVFIASRVTKKLQPRMILADEVGLGKTIEAGLILKELRARGLVERVLIVTPASLQFQWRTELKSKFNEDFEVINSAGAKYLGAGGANPFTKRDNVIVSLNFAKTDKRREQIIEAPWDLVIFDEAHHVRRSLRGNRVQATIAYDMADELKELVSGFLLLTATPMQLHQFELFSLVELVEPGLFRDYRHFEQRRRDLPRLNTLMKRLLDWDSIDESNRTAIDNEYRDLLASAGCSNLAASASSPEARTQLMDDLSAQHPLAETMIRNRKAEIGGFAGREAHSILVDLTPDEEQLFEDIGEYLRNEYDLAVASKQNALGFLMVTYQKMLASSPAAVLSSFRNRIEKLERRRKDVARGVTKRAAKGDPIEDVLENLEGDELLELLADDSPTWSDHQLEFEISRLMDLARRLERLEHDSKASQLLDALEDIWSEHPGEKIVIFTSFKATQEYLRRLIERELKVDGRRSSVAVFNGSMSAEEKEVAIKAFREKADVLIATEAGGEGRNLQFAHLLVNYDLPWNPMRVEQRIGRLDRIGQRKKVFVYNLACAGTVEERVLSVLSSRIRVFEESVGSLDPILGGLEDDLARIVMADKARFAEFFQQLESDIERRTVQARENERLLADFALDRASFRRDEANRILGAEPMAAASDLQRFVSDALEYLGGTLFAHPDGGYVITLSQRLRDRMAAPQFTWHGVFDPEEALIRDDLDFFALGHPFIEMLVDHVLDSRDCFTTARLSRKSSNEPALEIIYELQAGTQPPRAQLVRHTVGADLRVEIEPVQTLPVLAPGTDASVPGWATAAIEASQESHRRELQALRQASLAEHEDLKRAAAERAVRIFEYRQVRLTKRIQDEAEWIQSARASADPKKLKILPAREGKLRKQAELLRDLEAAHQRDIAEIENREISVSSRVWSITVLAPS